MDTAQDSIKQMVIKRHHLNKDMEDSFQIRNMADIQATLESTTQTMTLLLGSIAAISLLVGRDWYHEYHAGLGDRTYQKKIGLRKAMGARKADIISQFLIESVVMTFTGVEL